MLDIFNENQWQRIQDSYENWWQRKTDRPILHLSFDGVDPGMPRPKGIITESLFRYPADESAESIAEKLEYIMRSRRYEYDGYPYIWMYFGPIFSVEYFGVRPHIAENTVWYEAENLKPIEEMHISLDENSVFYPRNRKLAKAIEERFHGGYVISGGKGGGSCLDYVAEFYKPTELSYMLYDKPDEVNRLAMEFHKATCAVSKDNRTLTPSARGYTAWGGIYAPIPWTSMQCDYCAMIGPEHFERFVKWDLELCINDSPRYNYYHLDGPGQLIHLDSILSIRDLKCVQWVPGAGQKPVSAWPEIYKKISIAEKNIWVISDQLEDIEIIADQIGTTKGLYWYGNYPISEYDRVMKIAERIMNNIK